MGLPRSAGRLPCPPSWTKTKTVTRGRAEGHGVKWVEILSAPLFTPPPTNFPLPAGTLPGLQAPSPPLGVGLRISARGHLGRVEGPRPVRRFTGLTIPWPPLLVRAPGRGRAGCRGGWERRVQDLARRGGRPRGCECLSEVEETHEAPRFSRDPVRSHLSLLTPTRVSLGWGRRPSL